MIMNSSEDYDIYRIEYVTPSLENSNTTAYTHGEHRSIKAALGQMERDSNGFGTVISVQKQRVERSVWKTDLTWHRSQYGDNKEEKTESNGEN